MRFLLVLCCLLSVWITVAQEDEDIDTIETFIQEHREDVAVLCDTPGALFSHQADEPFPMASAFKLFVLAELARQYDAGTADPDDEITLEIANSYWLPGTDGGAHDLFLAELGAGRSSVTLRELAYGMIRYSSNAATDALMEYLGYDGYPALVELLSIENTEMPTRPLLGDFLLVDNHETGPVDPAALDDETAAAESARLADLYRNDPDWRAAEADYLAKRRAAAEAAISTQNFAPVLAMLEQQRAYGELFLLQGTAHDLLRAITAAYAGSAFSDTAKMFMQDTLNWILAAEPRNKDMYAALGTKGGAWAGILTGVWYVQPHGGGATRLAVLYRELPIPLWGELSTTGAHQNLEVGVFAFGAGCEEFERLLAVSD